MLVMDVSFKFHHQKKMGFDSILPPGFTGGVYNTSHFGTYAPTMKSCNQSMDYAHMHFVDMLSGFNDQQHIPSKEPMKKISQSILSSNCGNTPPVRHQIDSQSMSFFVVGGFVGSKSQAGGSSHRGRGFNLIWDIIYNKIKAPQMNGFRVDFCKKSADFQRGDVHHSNMEDSSKEVKSNKSYAEVTKGPPESIIAGAFHDLLDRQDWTNRLKVSPFATDESDRACVDEKSHNGSVEPASEARAATLNGDLDIDVCVKAVVSSPIQRSSSQTPDQNPKPDLVCSMCPVGEHASFKNRTLSDCSVDSDDSFIVFDGPDHCDDILLEDSDDDFSEDENSDDDSEEVLPGDFSTASENDVVSANARWNLNCVSGVEKPKKTPSKKVTFAEGKDLVKVKKMVVWAYAHRASRKANWDQVVLDRGRFNARITATAQIINRVLEPKHRERIYDQRFNTD